VAQHGGGGYKGGGGHCNKQKEKKAKEEGGDWEDVMISTVGTMGLKRALDERGLYKDLSGVLHDCGVMSNDCSWLARLIHYGVSSR
jgi:hypothetical protein